MLSRADLARFTSLGAWNDGGIRGYPSRGVPDTYGKCPDSTGLGRLCRRGTPAAEPRPVLRAADRLAWAGTLCGVAGVAAIWIGNLLGKGAVGPSLIAGFICFAYALALYGWAAARRARLSIAARGMPAAMAVWRAAWYCDECDGVFFEPGALRQGPAVEVIEGRVITPAAFHRLVWKVGRYAVLPGRLGRLALRSPAHPRRP